MGDMSHTAERAADLLAALDLLVRHRNAEPAAYRTVHAAATDAIGALHADLLDPRAGGDFDAAVAEHARLARRLRDLPRPTTGQPLRGGQSLDPLVGLLGRARSSGTTLDGLLGDMAAGVVPQVERAVRDGLRDLFSAAERPSPPDPGAPDDPAAGGRDV